MADVTKIKLPDNSVVNIKDNRIPGIDEIPTENSENIITSGGVYDAIVEVEEVIAAALNDLNDRVLDLESSKELPSYNSSNNGQFLGVVNGSLEWVTPITIYTGTGSPDASTGNNGDIYIQTSE